MKRKSLYALTVLLFNHKLCNFPYVLLEQVYSMINIPHLPDMLENADLFAEQTLIRVTQRAKYVR